MALELREINDNAYESALDATGKAWRMAREHGETVNGKHLNGSWVLRDPEGAFIDYDQYRFDLEARRGLKLVNAR